MAEIKTPQPYESELGMIGALHDDSVSELVEVEGFTVRNHEEVGSFLRENRFLVTLALEARNEIRKHFPESELLLEVLRDTEGIDPDILYLYVSTDLSPTDARPRLNSLDNGWWLHALRRAQGKLCISLEYR